MSHPGADIERVIEQLRELADHRTFRFKDTRRDVAIRYLAKLQRYEGFALEEVDAAEQRMGVVFPASFRAFLLRLGRSRGELFCGSDVAGLDEFAEYNREASAILGAVGLALPVNAVVFLLHQGYSFAYVIGAGGADSPVHAFAEGQEQVSVAAPSFGAFLDSELGLMREVRRLSNQHGGYWVTVFENGRCRETHPALSSGERPLEGPDRFIRWWELWK